MSRCLLLLGLILGLSLVGCSRSEAPGIRNSGKLQIVTTLYPLYDFVRSIGGDQVEVTLLLPPGGEAHSFDPKPEDIVRVNRAGLFIYTNRTMEPWAAEVSNSVNPAKVTIVDASVGVHFLPARDDGHGHAAGNGIDPHVWLDFDNAGVMIKNIANAMASKDPAHAALYQANAVVCLAKLTALDAAYRTTLAGCKQKTLLQGGHFALGYLAARYGLVYHAAASIDPEAEPTAAALAALVEEMRRKGLHYLFSEELVSPKLAETIAREAGGDVLLLSAAHNVSRTDFEGGVTFFDLMTRNLVNLRTGLECQ